MTEHEYIDVTPTAIVPAAAPMTLFGTDDPVAIIESASKKATALADVIRKRNLYVRIGPKEHVYLEGWTLLGSLVGVYAVPVWSRPLPDGQGWEARVEARTLAGNIVGAAEAECLYTEKKWENRDDYALRSMAQSRAASKALRLPLGFILQLAGFDATPAEEAPHDDDERRPQRQQARPSTPTRPAAAAEPRRGGGPDPEGRATTAQCKAIRDILNRLLAADRQLRDDAVVQIESEAHGFAREDGSVNPEMLTAQQARQVITYLQKVQRGEAA